MTMRRADAELHIPDPRPIMRKDAVERLGSRLDQLAALLSDDERTALSAILKIRDRQPTPAGLAALPADEVLTPREIEIFEQVKAEPVPTGRGLRPHTVVVMKSTRYCNLRCTYCHYWRDGPDQIMDFEVLVRATRGVIAAPTVRAVDFCWHGGEVTILPPAFYSKAFWIQEQFRGPRQYVHNSLQTNATRLTPDWINFIKRHKLGVGVSLDGPPEVHDRRRVDVRGRTTAAQVRQGLDLLRANGISCGVLMVVDDDVIAAGAERVLTYLMDIGVKAVAVLNRLPDNDAVPGPYYEFPRQVEFFRDLFRLWWPRYVDRITIRELDDLVNRVKTGRGQMCIFDGNCMGGFLTVEPTGEVGACDKFLGDDNYRFGNVLDIELANLAAHSGFAAVDRDTAAGVEGTSSCPWFDVCHGGCPHDRYLRRRKGSSQGESCCGLAPLLEDIAEAGAGLASASAVSRKSD